MKGKNLSVYYDVIIAGAGASGLSLLMHIIETGWHLDKKILLIDREVKNKNDRTWCFWENVPRLFEEIVFRKWSSIYFNHPTFNKKINISPYQYKMVRGIDFYNYCHKKIKLWPQIERVYEEIEEVKDIGDMAEVITSGQIYKAHYCFSSLLDQSTFKNSKSYCMLQHFKGWVIKTEDIQFDVTASTFMDFRVGQKTDTRFVYILPFDESTAMIEYTVFSEKLLKENEYDEGIKKYLKDVLKINSYEILDVEYGVIPMTDYNFPMHHGNVFYIGTAGGQTKASTGFTFQFIQEQSRVLAEQLKNNQKINLTKTFSKKRFAFYDSVLLNILLKKKLQGRDIFKTMFEKNEAAIVLKFLENKTNIFQEAKMFMKLPIGIFLKTAIEEAKRRCC